MLSYKFKKNLLIILISLSFFLLAVNILLKNNLLDSENAEKTFNEIEIAERFRNVLDDFGIDAKQIKESKKIDKHSGREIINFKVQIPIDLTIPELLQGIYQTFLKDSLKIISIEKVKGGKSILTLKSGSATLLQAEFDYSKKYSRNKGFIVFIIDDVDLENSEVVSLIESPTKLNFLIRPESKFIQLTKNVIQNSQQYSVLIDDDINEQKYELGPGFSDARIKNVVKTLVTDFQRAVCFIIDDKSDFYKSKEFKTFQNELDKRSIKLFETSRFVHLSNDENTILEFDDKIKSLGDGGTIIFLLNVASYLTINPELIKYQKKGFRVITSSLVL